MHEFCHLFLFLQRDMAVKMWAFVAYPKEKGPYYNWDPKRDYIVDNLPHVGMLILGHRDSMCGEQTRTIPDGVR